ncbi:MAG: DegT/DnrJ/EryC1/StrS family aminotransferase [Cyanobacteriota bacterium]
MIDYENLNKVNKRFFKEFKSSFEETLESGWYILGNKVKSFEKEFSVYNSIKYCVGVASGLDALKLSLKSFDLPEGSEVIVPSNTYIATIIAVLRANLVPVLVEPNILTYNLDPEKIEEKITKKTKIILPVHLYGKLSNMSKICELALKYDLKIIEDCAQAHGANYKNKKAGTYGDIGAFSFYPTKNLGALGDAGAIITDDAKLAEKVKMLGNYGSVRKYYNEVIGYNSRMDEVQAGFLSVKLKYLDQINEHKRKLAKIYNEYLSDKFIKPTVCDNYFDVYHIYPIRIKERDKLKVYLLDKGIKTEIHYPIPPHQQKALKGIFKEDYPVAEEIHQTILSLPLSYAHSEDEILQVVEIMNKF